MNSLMRIGRMALRDKEQGVQQPPLTAKSEWIAEALDQSRHALENIGGLHRVRIGVLEKDSPKRRLGKMTFTAATS